MLHIGWLDDSGLKVSRRPNRSHSTAMKPHQSVICTASHANAEGRALFARPLQRFVGRVFAHDQMPQTVTLNRRSELFNDHAINLIIVWNNRSKPTIGLRTTDTALKSIENVFQAVVDVVYQQSIAIKV